MKKLLFIIAAVLCIGIMSCKTMKSQKQKEADLSSIFDELKSKFPGSDVSYANGRVMIILSEMVYFKVGSAELNQSSSNNLNELASVLKRYPRTSIDLNGHTDNTGTKAINQKLSLDRALSVKSYLEEQGVKGRRMLTDGLADARPVASNNTDEGRRQNRRVEFVIYY